MHSASFLGIAVSSFGLLCARRPSLKRQASHKRSHPGISVIKALESEAFAVKLGEARYPQAAIPFFMTACTGTRIPHFKVSSFSLNGNLCPLVQAAVDIQGIPPSKRIWFEPCWSSPRLILRLDRKPVRQTVAWSTGKETSIDCRTHPGALPCNGQPWYYGSADWNAPVLFGCWRLYPFVLHCSSTISPNRLLEATKRIVVIPSFTRPLDGPFCHRVASAAPVDSVCTCTSEANQFWVPQSIQLQRWFLDEPNPEFDRRFASKISSETVASPQFDSQELKATDDQPLPWYRDRLLAISVEPLHLKRQWVGLRLLR